MIADSLLQIQNDIREGKYTLTDVLAYYINNIEASVDYNTYVEVFNDTSFSKAQVLQDKFETSPEEMGPLFGAVISIKDNLCYSGHKVSAASKMLDGFVSPYSATAVQRLLDADAIIIGRTNCDEFSMGSTSESSFFGPPLNAVDKTKISGGSTGGGAAAVKLNTCLASIGSDTGGSVRQPAALNGVMGYKPTYGLISRWGLIAYGSSFDQIGILAHQVNTIAEILNVISGPDEYDSTAIQDAPENFKDLLPSTKNIKVAYIDSMINHPSLAPDAKKASLSFIERIQAQGIETTPVEFGLTDLLVPTYYILICAEASSNLSRFDGIRFGHQSKETSDDYRDLIKKSRTEGFGFEVKKRIMLGTYVLSEGYYDAYYKKAQRVRRMIREQVESIFNQYDFIITPTTIKAAWAIGETQMDPIETYLSDVYTVLANLCGMPAISIPIENNSSELPLGIQIMSNRLQDKSLLNFIKQIEELA